VVALALTMLVALPASGAAPRNPRLGHVHTWAFAIGDGDLAGNLARRYAAYDLVVVDGEGATARQIATLRSAGKIVLGYLDVGTIESHRSWYPLLKPYRLAFWSDWAEWYANVAKPGFRHAIVARIAPALLRKRFDGLFLDNTDMIEAYPGQTAGMRALVRALSGLVHARRGLLFAQNGESSIGPLVRYYDGWNREDVTATYDFAGNRYVLQPPGATAAAQQALRRIAAAGLLVLATDYTASHDTASAALAVGDACAAGALPFVSDIGLTRVPAVPARCP
jgi:endo-alpha-1,4-polygalactosaminidase (GH114 family)